MRLIERAADTRTVCIDRRCSEINGGSLKMTQLLEGHVCIIKPLERRDRIRGVSVNHHKVVGSD